MKKLIVLLFALILVGCKAKTDQIIPTKNINTHVEPFLLSLPGGNPAYGSVCWEEQKLVYMPNVNVPMNWDVIAPLPGSMYLAGDFANGDFSKMYIVSYGFHDLRLMDMKTGIAIPIGKLDLWGGGGWTGMAIAEDGTAYLSSVNEAGSFLYTVDLKTAKTKVIGQIPLAPVLIDIAIYKGVIYGLDIHYDYIVKINPDTLATTILGNVGFDANWAQDMDFDDATGILYLAAYNDTIDQGELRVVDLKTGLSTLVGTFPNGDEVDAFAIASVAKQPKNIYLPLIMKGKEQ